MGSKADDGDCPICLSPLGEGATFSLDCGHRFHTGCIVEALRRSGPTCPMCRAGPKDAAPPVDPQEALVEAALRALFCGGVSDSALRGAAAALSRLVASVGGHEQALASLARLGGGDGQAHTWSFHIQF